MHTTAHPDDENNAMLALVRAARRGARRAGDGDPRRRRPERDRHGALRRARHPAHRGTAAAHRFDGAEQYFTRAVDFGYSFSPQETLEKWGRQEILGDFVRHIRAIRPDVIVAMSPEGTGGGQHHQASAILATEAFRAAADPAQFPEQIREGLRPWQALKLYRPAGGLGGRGGRGAPGAGQGRRRAARRRAPARAPAADGTFATLDTSIYEPLLGCTIGEVGGVASGHAHVPGPRADGCRRPARRAALYRLVETHGSEAQRRRRRSSTGIDMSLGGLARYAGERPPAALS